MGEGGPGTYLPDSAVPLVVAQTDRQMRDSLSTTSMHYAMYTIVIDIRNKLPLLLLDPCQLDTPGGFATHIATLYRRVQDTPSKYTPALCQPYKSNQSIERTARTAKQPITFTVSPSNHIRKLSIWLSVRILFDLDSGRDSGA